MSRPAALALAALLALAGCSADPGSGSRAPSVPSEPSEPASSSTGPSPAPPTRAPAPPPPPGPDTCHRLSYAAAVAPTARSGDVPCSEEHTSQTFYVGELDRTVGGRLLAVDAARLQDQAAAACPERLAAFVGGTEDQRRLSMLRAVWFTPSVAQSDRGAEWLRCDVVAVAAPQQLLPLFDRIGGVLDTEAGRERFGMCGTAEPGTRDFRRVACGEDHAWRALRTVPFPAGDYPGDQAVRDAGRDPCTDAARAVADDPLDFRWGYEWPTEEQWDGGQGYGLCWAPDS